MESIHPTAGETAFSRARCGPPGDVHGAWRAARDQVAARVDTAGKAARAWGGGGPPPGIIVSRKYKVGTRKYTRTDVSPARHSGRLGMRRSGRLTRGSRAG